MHNNFEADVLHPAVENWLRVNSYRFEHEVELPGGRVDFFCWKDDKSTIFLECKRSNSKLLTAIRQLQRYAAVYSEMMNTGEVPSRVISLMIAMPNSEITNFTKMKCESTDIQLVGIEIETTFTETPQKTVYMTDETKAALKRIAEAENLRSPRGEISVSAAVKWLAEQYDKKQRSK